MSALRVVTWNVRHGLGRDRRVDLDRVARVLRPLDADVIALQELDQRRARTGHVDQPRRLGELLERHPTFLDAVHDPDGGRYGHALLTRGPSFERRIELPWVPLRERRGALDVEVRHDGAPIRVLSVHLGLLELERRLQIRPLLHAAESDPRPTLLLGDMNAGPRQGTLRALRRRFEDGAASTPAKTWHSALPLRRLDYVLVRGLRSTRAEVLRDGEASTASDHLPLVVDLTLG